MLSVYLMSTAHLTELLKLPALVAHFSEHRNESEEMTWWDFFCMHYGQGNVFDDDRDKDMKLPFKSVTVFSPSAFICSPLPELLVSPWLPPAVPGLKFSQYKSVYSSLYPASIWHPPKWAAGVLV